MKIKASRIAAVLRSFEFQEELTELSSYAANIKQERPIVLLLAKFLYRQKQKVVIEEKRCDLVIDTTKIEFKYHFDCDRLKVERELSNVDEPNETFFGVGHSKWKVCPGIYNDVINKRPDIFVWIICSRDLSLIKREDLSKIVWSRQQLKYNKLFSYNANGECPQFAIDLLYKLKSFREFTLSCVKVITSGTFPSTYYFLLCDFVE
jgi:hypothetical protein